MKKLIFTITVASSFMIKAQISGNINYENQRNFPENFLTIPKPNSDETLFSVKGLANIKADSYVAVFSVTQVGKSQEEANGLIDERISSALTLIKKGKNIETYVDVISFVPTYEYEVEKKIFSKKTYNEVPAGFEIKKNIHIKFNEAAMLEEFMKVLSANEIYDLVRVDYYASALENIRKELETKARIQIQEKIKNYELLIGKPFESNEKSVSDGFLVKLPVEMYRSYEASRSTTLNLRKSANVTQSDKTTTIFYHPVMNKEFDFVINPIVVEPVIQVMYEIKVLISKSDQKNQKEYMIVTPNGELKNLNIKP